ncbi:MAG: Gfo/Idh/MocA family oxidoreductase [Christensenellaceae bacterium]|jgi:predicted dehydrogenase|nr:Gfo/Idh/MocA family oxidoreductase [Christensenellaceae bacterium]
MDITILGAGSRGVNAYGRILHHMPGVRIGAICDINEEKRLHAKETFNLINENIYTNEDEFFSNGVIGDALIIASMDHDHFRHTTKAISAGYKKILLEKPVSQDINETQEIARLAKENNVDILVCHVLRYSKFYKTIRDVIRSGQIGNVMTIHHQENIAHWHFAHSFTRGNWRNTAESAPLIFAKTCHDFDLLYWFADSKFTDIESYGALSYFNQENAPEGCSKRCLDNCKYYDTCAFSVKKAYIDWDTPLNWGFFHATGKNNPTTEEKITSLKNPNNPYGRCVYYCDNDLCDHQSAVMQFESGATATLTVTAFTKDNYRKIHITGTKGELYGSDQDSYISVNIFGKKPSRGLFRRRSNRISIRSGIGGHHGGDSGICDTFVKLIRGDEIDADYLTTIDVTLVSHNILSIAEEKRQAKLK